MGNKPLIEKYKFKSGKEKLLMLVALAAAAYGLLGLTREYQEGGISLYIIPAFIAIAIGAWSLTKLLNKPIEIDKDKNKENK
ncbi:hypothetical protein PNIG_p0020 (plasmid) [Pseudoalteromonas nigrifaciens]|uniref:Uncharacterized protein n=1 Tax=Pseudoalteromonas nigrifaciens TaxID=28109 RepID=A0AAC9UMC7_9GAMM|nr:hypothetical protein [Pseudoalteromonas nigrifaciens]ASM56303.1 hypothetical protein PNIG_p0020 [Pseudoalteromonas nigrifaciens]GEN43300.1 hypothetical protein PNI02_27660 [Pseudoalteromonas nigrifaciens]SUD25069.1 Uncharacterised protein [Pseudoalteromonas nigrifaciens]